MEPVGKSYTNSTTITKLILLYVFDKMEVPLTESTILNMCANQNDWVNYMTCRSVLADLVEIGFIHSLPNPSAEPFFTITADGRACLSYFFMKIPSSLREDISAYVKENRLNFRRKQEYFRNYYKNTDGTYTVLLRIVEPSSTVMELKLSVANRAAAKAIYEKWEKKASNVYSSIYDILIE